MSQQDLFSQIPISSNFYIDKTGKKRCSCCNQVVSQRCITLYRGMVLALIMVYNWCKDNGRHEFTRKEIKHLFTGSENLTARFGDWVMFGGLLYKPDGKGTWGVNMERTKQFLDGSLEIPTTIWKDPVSGLLTREDYKLFSEIPNLSEFLDENYKFIARYKN